MTDQSVKTRGASAGAVHERFRAPRRRCSELTIVVGGFRIAARDVTPGYAATLAVEARSQRW